jgi:hypothetical protein
MALPRFTTEKVAEIDLGTDRSDGSTHLQAFQHFSALSWVG